MNVHELKDRVRVAIGKGWQPLGGLSVESKDRGCPVLHQAMVKDEDNSMADYLGTNPFQR